MSCVHYYRLLMVGRLDGVPMYATAVSLLHIIHWYARLAKGDIITLRSKNLRRAVAEYAKAHGCRGELDPLTFRHLMRIVRAVLRRVNTRPVNGDIHIVHVEDILRTPPEEAALLFLQDV
jgi:hypothetical protein